VCYRGTREKRGKAVVLLRVKGPKGRAGVRTVAAIAAEVVLLKNRSGRGCVCG